MRSLNQPMVERARAEAAKEVVHQLRGEYFILALEVSLPPSSY